MTVEVVAPPDLVPLIRTYLLAELPAYVYPAPTVIGTEVPNPRPQRFIRMEHGGGTRRDQVVFETVLMFEAWAPTAYEAMRTIEAVRALIHAMPAATRRLGFAARVNEYGAPSILADTISGTPRGMFTAVIVSPPTVIGLVAET